MWVIFFFRSVIMCAAAPVIFQMCNTWEELQPLPTNCSCTADIVLDGRPAIPQKLSISLPQANNYNLLSEARFIHNSATQ